MENITESYKTRFNIILEPMKRMLANLQETMSPEDWIGFVERTRTSIITNPDQYLGRDVPDRPSLSIIVTIIFDEFLEEMLPVQ